MDVTTKDLLVAPRNLVGHEGKAFPSARAIRIAVKERGSSARANHALIAIQVERGINTHLREKLPADFQAELATAPVPVPSLFDNAA